MKGNGNYLERVLGKHQLIIADELAELAPLAKAAISKRYFRHYRGFARQQEAEALKSPTAKKILYVLRTALTGAHDAHAKSALPEEPANVAALERWLIDIRLRELER